LASLVSVTACPGSATTSTYFRPRSVGNSAASETAPTWVPVVTAGVTATPPTRTSEASKAGSADRYTPTANGPGASVAWYSNRTRVGVSSRAARTAMSADGRTRVPSSSTASRADGRDGLVGRDESHFLSCVIMMCLLASFYPDPCL
jgi:hypothetical protein